MIYFITGKPRHGKGLYSLQTIQKKALAENRQVYYMGIDGLKLDWKQLDKIEDWPHLPHGAIIVFDECHKYFPQDKIGSQLPHHVEFLAEHAHHGYDMYFITQSPKRVSTFLRDRVEEHHHLIRQFGKEKANLYKFYDVQTIPLSARSKEDGIKSTFNYPTELYGQYNSSEMHNVKVSVPLRYYMLFAIPVLVCILAYYGYMGLKSTDKITEPETAIPSEYTPSRHQQKENDKDKMLTTGEYIAVHQPRIEGMPQSAPKYDEITEPTSAPYPAACVLSRNKCLCYSQQATKLEVPEAMCLQIVSNGYFLDFDANQSQQQNNQSQTRQTSSNEVSERSSDIDWQLNQDTTGMHTRSEMSNAPAT